MAFTGFDRRFFEFFKDLAQNNERAWFQRHKQDYEAGVVTPMLAFISAMGPRLATISPHFKADPRKQGGSMFRIYRDTRFSKDKTPYKTHAAAQFRHVLGKDVHAPGFYAHISTTEVFIGGGIWRPPAESLAKIRQAIVERPEDWLAARDDPAFRKTFKLHGDALKRPPRGFDKDHPLIDDLKRKDFVGACSLPPELIMQPIFLDVVADSFAAAGPFIRFICKALAVPY